MLTAWMTSLFELKIWLYIETRPRLVGTPSYGFHRLAPTTPVHLDALSNSHVGDSMYAIKFGSTALASASFSSSSINLPLASSYGATRSNGLRSYPSIFETLFRSSSLKPASSSSPSVSLSST